MALRFTPTFAICVLGAAVTGALLALPPADAGAPAPLPAPVSAAPGAGPAATPVAIEIQDFSFGRSRTVAAGAVVQVSNADAAAHTLTAEDGAFDTGSVGTGTTRLVHRTGHAGHVRVLLRDPSIDDRLTGRRLTDQEPP